MGRSDPSDAPALERGLQVLGVLATAGIEGIRAAELYKRVGIPRSSLYRILKPLQDRGHVTQDPVSGQYRLGMGLLQLGFRARNAMPIVQAVRPILREISQATQQLSELAVNAGSWRLMMLEVWQATGTPLRIQSRPGLFFALDHTTAHGLVYLAFDGERRLTGFMRAVREARARKPGAGLRAACKRYRSQGYASKRQGHDAGNNIRVAVPVYDPHAGSERLAGSLGIACDTQDINALRAAEWAVLLRAGARRLEKEL